MVEVLFVCLGNICRSPTAHGVFRDRVAQAGLSDRIRVDSAGTGDWHIGRGPDPRTQAAAQLRGYDLSELRARQVEVVDFDRFHYILAMDKTNLANLQALRPAHFQGELRLFLDYAHSHAHAREAGTLDCSGLEVPDPYYGESDGFEQVLDLVEAASDGLLDAIRRHHGLVPA